MVVYVVVFWRNKSSDLSWRQNNILVHFILEVSDIQREHDRFWTEISGYAPEHNIPLVPSCT
jgi:hypothetical protein